jgi:D-erythrose 4-phosphate dehydrogenase
MKSFSIAITGCGRVGESVVSALLNHKHKIKYFMDINDENSIGFIKKFNFGELIRSDVKINEFPEVDIIVDSSGDIELLEFWKQLINIKKIKGVILTRRESQINNKIMVGISQPPYMLGENKIISIGSCTGNGIVPFAVDLSKAFPVKSITCRVLHPLKQSKVFDMRVIETALNDSFYDFAPDLSEGFFAQSMEIPVDRGMALDISICFKNKVIVDELNKYLALKSEKDSIFEISRIVNSSSTIIGNKNSSVLDPDWMFCNNQFRALIWQDNEFGYANRVLDVLNNLGV